MALPRWLGVLGRLLGSRTPARPPAMIEPGARVRLRTPLATPHKVWVPAGATGIVVGWSTPAREVSLELDAPRTLITVPWAWVEEEPPPAAAADPPTVSEGSSEAPPRA